jgi:hypothetical protein
MFADAALAARIDRAEARLCAAIANAVGACQPERRSTVLPISGGLAIYVSPSSPVNMVIGLALDTGLDMERPRGLRGIGKVAARVSVSNCRCLPIRMSGEFWRARLQVGDRFTEEESEWEIASRP